MNQSASIGSNVTFICRVSGHSRPWPIIAWTKGNNSDILQTDNLRVQTITDIQKGQSQLVITGIRSEDHGSYRCIARNSAGMRTSRAAFLYPKVIGETLYLTCMLVLCPFHRRIRRNFNVSRIYMRILCSVSFANDNLWVTSRSENRLVQSRVKKPNGKSSSRQVGKITR